MPSDVITDPGIPELLELCRGLALSFTARQLASAVKSHGFDAVRHALTLFSDLREPRRYATRFPISWGSLPTSRTNGRPLS